MSNHDIELLKEENASLRKEVEHLKEELIRMVGRNLSLSEQLDRHVDLRRRVEVAREIMEGHKERQLNADLKDDGQLMALIEMKVESMKTIPPDFDTPDLAKLLGVSQTRLKELFRHQTIFHSPDAYIDNLRVINALKLLREKPQYNIAIVAEEAGFSNVRTLQRRIQDAIGMTPVEYRLMMTQEID